MIHMQADLAAFFAAMYSSCKSLQAPINQTNNRKTKRYSQAKPVSVTACARLQCAYAPPAEAGTAQYVNMLFAWVQDKKKAEADRQKELNDLFAIAIKQPKVPPGKT